MYLGNDGKHRTECKKLQCRHFLVELFRQEIDIGLASCGFLPTLQQIKLRQHLFREETRHQEGTTTSGANLRSRPEAGTVTL